MVARHDSFRYLKFAGSGSGVLQEVCGLSSHTNLNPNPSVYEHEDIGHILKFTYKMQFICDMNE